MFLDYLGGKVSGRVTGTCPPVGEQAVGPAVEHAVDSHGGAAAQTAAVVVTRGVEPGVQPGLDGPVLDVSLEPLRGREFRRGSAGDEFERFRGQAGALPLHAGGLRCQREAGLFSMDWAGHERAVTALTTFSPPL